MSQPSLLGSGSSLASETQGIVDHHSEPSQTGDQCVSPGILSLDHDFLLGSTCGHTCISKLLFCCSGFWIEACRKETLCSTLLHQVLCTGP